MYFRELQDAIQEYNIIDLMARMYCYFDGKFRILPSIYLR